MTVARIVIKGGASLGAFKMPNNKKRATWGKAALRTHSKLVGDLNEPLESQFVDLLANLRHAAQRDGVNFDDALRTSEGHFNAEVHEEPAGSEEVYRGLRSSWYATGIQDYQNVGNPADLADDAGLTPSDTWDTIKQKIKKMLLDSANLETQVTDNLSPEESKALTLKQKRALLNDWADAWTDAAVSDLKKMKSEEEKNVNY